MKKITVYLLTIILTLTLMTTISSAASFKLNATPSATTVSQGQEIELTLSISDIDVGENGINVVEGVLDYDHNIFEEIDTSAITSLNNWALTYNNENTDLNGKFLAMFLGNGVKANQDIAKIKLKVKSGVQNQAVKINVKNVTTNDGTNIIKTDDKVVSLTIGTVSSGNNNNNQNNNAGTNNGNNSGNNNGNSNNNQSGEAQSTTTVSKPTTTTTSKTTNNKTSSNTAKKLPQTGTYDVYVISAITIFAVISVISYIKYKKM